MNLIKLLVALGLSTALLVSVSRLVAPFQLDLGRVVQRSVQRSSQAVGLFLTSRVSDAQF